MTTQTLPYLSEESTSNLLFNDIENFIGAESTDAHVETYFEECCREIESMPDPEGVCWTYDPRALEDLLAYRDEERKKAQVEAEEEQQFWEFREWCKDNS